MKKKPVTLLLSSMFISFSLVMFFASCKKDDNKNDDNKNNTMYTIAATLKGVSSPDPYGTGTGTAMGTVTGTYDAGTNLLTYNVTWSGLTGAATAGYFHAPDPVIIPTINVK